MAHSIPPPTQRIQQLLTLSGAVDQFVLIGEHDGLDTVP